MILLDDIVSYLILNIICLPIFFYGDKWANDWLDSFHQFLREEKWGMDQKMTDEQFQLFKNQLIIAMDTFVAQGGKIVPGTFGNAQKMCPISTVFKMHGKSAPNDNIAKDLSSLLGFTIPYHEFWAFIFIFDGAEKTHTLEIEYPNISQLAQELRQKYLPPKRSMFRKLRDVIGV